MADRNDDHDNHGDDNNNNHNSNNNNNNGEDNSNNKVTAESYGNINTNSTSTVDKECWLIRIPPRLAEIWDQVPQGTVLGELIFQKGGGVDPKTKRPIKPNLSVQVSETLQSDLLQQQQQQQQQKSDVSNNKSKKKKSTTTGASSSSSASSSMASTPLPLNYSLQAMTKKIPTMHPFIRNTNGSITITGTVSRTANLQVSAISDSNYRELCKKRLLNATVNNSSFVKPVSSNPVVAQQQKSSGKAAADSLKSNFGQAVHNYGKRMLEAVQLGNQLQQQRTAKRARFTEDQPTKSVMFELFEQQQYWTVKDLKLASGGRPENEIRDVLREIGEYHRSGDHKNTWELRKEFQKAS